MEKASKKKVCFICSAGGHFEQIKQLNKIRDKYEHYYILPKNSSTKKFNQKKYVIHDFYKNNKIQYIVSFIITAIEQFFLFIKERPNIIITTGAGFVVPTCLYAKLFHKKLIYIESFARMNSLNKTGVFLYKYADLFMVQWESLLQYYPKAIYRGWIY